LYQVSSKSPKGFGGVAKTVFFKEKAKSRNHNSFKNN
jgi:hypothetical protein